MIDLPEGFDINPVSVRQLKVSKDSKIVIETDHIMSREQLLNIISMIKEEFKCDKVYILPKGMKMFVVD